MLKVHVLNELYHHSSNVAHRVEVPAGARLMFINGQVGTKPDGSPLNGSRSIGNILLRVAYMNSPITENETAAVTRIAPLIIVIHMNTDVSV